MHEKILLVDDEPDILQTLETLLVSEGFHVRKASEGQHALELFQSEPLDLVITDIRMPGMDGLELIKSLKHLDQEIEIIVLTGFATIDNAIEALHDNGAYDFLRKPLENLDVFFHTIHQALEKRRLRIQNRRLLEELRKHREHLEDLVEERTTKLALSNKQLQQEIIERKRAEQALRQAQKTALEAQHTAEAGNYAKTVFLANVSHELRTPLNGILGYAHILQYDSILTDSQKLGLDVIERCGKRLLSLVNDILDMSSLEAQQIELHQSDFQFPEFLAGIAEMTQRQAQQKGLVFHYTADPDLPAGIHGDEPRLRQVLLSLLNNAVRFTEEGDISLRVYELHECDEVHEPSTQEFIPSKTAKTIRFEVEDTGIGIPQGQLEEVFSPFKQVAEYLNKRSGGSGLGLAISRELIRMMNGELHVKSTLGEGSTFWFELELPEVAGTIEKKEEKDTEKIQPEREHEPIVPPPEEEVSRLYKLAMRGDIFSVRKCLEEIDRGDPKSTSFIAKARKLVQEMKVVEIQQFLKQYLHE